MAAPAWKLVWSDEFNGAKGATPDPSKWTYDIGGHGWGNQELEYYTDRNAAMDGEGLLVMEARKENYKGKKYTSARLKTQGLANWTYGKVEARIKVPTGKGIWPAFWMLGENISTVGWPTCGEIDIMEHVGHETDTTHGTIHGPGYSGGQGIGHHWKTKGGRSVADDFHVYSIEWTLNQIKWFVDGELFHLMDPGKIGKNAWVYDSPHFIILNLAVGGQWPGEPNSRTRFPARMMVDWVRVYKDQNLVIPADYKRAGGEYLGSVEAPKVRKYAGYKTINLPGLVQAEDFAAGDEGKGYYDSDPGNQGGAYRPDEGVDIQACGDGEEEANIGWAQAGEWLRYAVNATRAGKYTVEARVAAAGKGGKFHLEINGKPVGANFSVPDTGDWQNWVTLTREVTLSKGPQWLTVVMDQDSEEIGGIGNINWFRFK